ncbi:MAG: NAD(P)-dependent oxidoreductase [Polyangiales bacterium]
MRCLVTGATGFIGGGVLRGLRAAGHDVVAYVREGSDSRALEDVDRVVGDMGDPNRLASAAAGCDVMIHAAGVADPAAHPDTLGWAHVAGTENAINAAKQAGCRRFVHISCADATLYDGPRSFWTEAEAPQRPYGELARTKLHSEELARVSGKKGFWTVALRPGLVWGPRDTTHLPDWKAEAEAGGIRIIGGGKKLLATTYIDNLAHAVQCALRTTVTTGNVYYVVDTELSVSREFFTKLSEALGWGPPKSGGPYWWAWFASRTGLSSLHPTQVIRRGRTSAFDMGRAKQDLGYEPIVTRQQGLAELSEWYRQAQGSL